MQSKRYWQTFNALQEPDPRIAHCLKRKKRKEVLFSMKIAGRKRSPGRGGTYRRTIYSQWRC